MLLLVASYYFYAYWDYRFCSLLLLSTVVDFTAARRIDRTNDLSVRWRWLAVSIVVNLSMLGFFKYFNFFIETASPLVEAIGFSSSSLSIVLPVGISFYTFQTLSYTIDVYRGKLSPTDRILDFALYVAFFPQLVAGPIVRAGQLLPQLSRQPVFSKRRFYSGGQQLLRGAVKKVLVADRLGEMVDVVFVGPEFYSGLTTAVAIVAYTGQIYYDFSGYSDMAIGVAKLLGYRFPVNFRHPYLATSPAAFWRRWHITLSAWLRDYLYVPLGGNRGSTRQTCRNLVLTMAIGGLWHGAAWTFCLWGVWHGSLLCLQRFASAWGLGAGAGAYSDAVALVGGRLARAAGWSLTMAGVACGWMLFRSESVEQAAAMLYRVFTAAPGIDWFPPLAIAAIVFGVSDHVVWSTPMRRSMRLPLDAWYAPVITTIMILALLVYAPVGFQPFLYFQF